MVSQDVTGGQMRTVVFDLDGTLADTSGDLLAAANACFGLGAVLGPADALTAFQGGRAMLRLGFQRLGRGDEAEVDRQYPALLAAYLKDIDRETKVYPGAMAAVQGLRQAGFRTAICTNKPILHAEVLLERLGVRALFDAVVGADTLPVRKPDPAPYRLAVERAGGGRSLLVGDTVTDRDTARAAGVPVILVSFGPEGRGVQRLDPDAVLDDYADLPALAERLLS